MSGREPALVPVPGLFWSDGPMNSGRRVTIREVAEAAGVSIATVSRVMHGTYYVNPELCDRVRRFIDELGYVPDSNARSMKFKYRFMIGYLVSDISNQHFTAVGRAIEDVVGPAGYSLIVCSNDSQQKKELENLRALLSHRIDGLIINTSGMNDRYIAEISKSMPVVLLHRRIGVNDFAGDFVGNDNYKGGARLAEELLSAGHRDIGFIGSDASISTFRERTAGFFDRLAWEGVAAHPDRTAVDNYTQAGGHGAMGRLLDRSPSITAVCVINNAMAIGALKLLGERGIRVPMEMSVVSYGDIENGDLFFVRPTYISQKPSVIGRTAADLILSRIREPGTSPREEIVSTLLEAGGSVAPYPLAKGLRETPVS